jgi:hypothetical protein
MAIACRFKPIEKWPKQPTPKESRRNRFRAKWEDTLNVIEYELFQLGARDISIEAFFRANEIRNDGWPRSGAQPSQPGVILRFTTPKGEMEFASYQRKKGFICIAPLKKLFVAPVVTRSAIGSAMRHC